MVHGTSMRAYGLDVYDRPADKIAMSLSGAEMWPQAQG
jgi:hypothetical protein